MKRVVIYLHGKGGSAAEAEHYRSLFPQYEVIGLDYQADTPWKAREEFSMFFNALAEKYDNIVLIANSIGAYYAINSGIENLIAKAYFISPIVDMEKLICDMMHWAGVSEKQLEEQKTVHTEFGEDLSWEYLQYVRNNPVNWSVPTEILYGRNDNMTSLKTMESFAKNHEAGLTVMDNGEHWFHTAEQMNYLDNWIREKEQRRQSMNKYIGYCGLDCEQCEARIATEKNDDELRNKVAVLWSQLNGVEIIPSMINCTGCRLEGVKSAYCDALCPIRKCAMAKGCETCGDCPDMGTCDKLAGITANNPDALKNLK